MNEILQSLNALKADELEAVITRANIILEKKRKEEARQALLEKERLRRQTIAELERKLKELKSENTPLPEDAHGSSHVPSAAQSRPSSLVCPRCHQSNTPDSMFCAGCGKQLAAK